MALKPDRHVLLDNNSFFMNETATRGIVVVYSTGGSGAAMDTANAVVAAPTTVSGTTPAGVLLNDVVNLDLTRQHLNEHKDEVQINSKVALLKRGWIVTDAVSGTPTVGANAYYNAAGQFTPTREFTGAGADYENATTLKVGRFMGVTDADGFVKVAVDIE